MYAIDELNLDALEKQSARVQKVLELAPQPDGSLLIPWLADAPIAPAVPCGVAKVIRPQRIAELADAFERLREEDVAPVAKRCFLSEREMRQCFDQFKAYWRGLKHGKKALAMLVK
jgi:hypothetical protein